MQALRTQANWLHLPQKKGHPTERVPTRQRTESIGLASTGRDAIAVPCMFDSSQ